MPTRFNKKSHTWFFRFNRSKKSYFQGGFRTKKQAEEAEINQINNAIEKEIHPELAGQQMKFLDGTQWFFDNHSAIRKRTWKNDRGRIKVMAEFFGNKRLSEISAFDVSLLREHLKKKGLAANTANHYQAVLKAIYNRLKKFGLYSGDNPATKVDMEKVPRARTRFLYPTEEKTLTPQVKENPRLWPYYYVALHTGMRIKEICNIRVKDISIAGNTIFIPNSKSFRSRHVPVSNELSEFLSSVIASKQSESFALGGLSAQWVQRSLRKISDRIGINDFTFHDLRHTFAQRLLTKGVPIYIVSKILGHSSVVVTEQHYGHLAFADLKSAVDKIDGVISVPSCTQIALMSENKPIEFVQSY